jgi:zinc transport system substrate-binding protein
MKKLLLLIMIVAVISCGRNSNQKESKIITVSISPFKYFVEQIAGNDFSVNVMVPPGSNPHIYEPYPEQITKLSRSVAYISNGYLGFEMTWLDRFYEINPRMARLSVGEKIDPIASTDIHEGKHVEGADPHYWVSPSCARVIALSVRDFVCGLNPSGKERYMAGYDSLIAKIDSVDAMAGRLLKRYSGKSFMIYHPNLAYIARDYGLKEVSVEFEGKEPPPSRLKDLIDMAKRENIRTIFVQREYDSKNAREIAREIGGHITIIDPLSDNWLEAEKNIFEELNKNFQEREK